MATYNNSNHLTDFIWDYLDELVPEETFTNSYGGATSFIVHRKILEADAPTIWLDATQSGLLVPPPPSSHHFYARCRSCCNP